MVHKMMNESFSDTLMSKILFIISTANSRFYVCAVLCLYPDTIYTISMHIRYLCLYQIDWKSIDYCLIHIRLSIVVFESIIVCVCVYVLDGVHVR